VLHAIAGGENAGARRSVPVAVGVVVVAALAAGCAVLVYA
jgi:hypothetical protein